MSELKFTNVSKTFSLKKHKQVILKNCSVTFPSSGLVCIFGKSGSGKTTILNLISGLENVDSGAIYDGGRDITKFNDEARVAFRRDHIAYVFQNYNLVDDLSVKDQVKLYLSIRAITTNEEKIKNKFIEFNLLYLYEQKISTLSGGEKQRVAIICALLSESRIFLFDEPTGALDLKNSHLIMKDIQKIAQEHLVIMVSHNHRLIEQYATNIFSLVNGELINSKRGNQKKVFPVNHPQKTKHSFLMLLLKRYFKKNLLSNIITLLVSIFSFTVLFFSVSFILSGDALINRSLLERANALSVDLVKKEKRQENGTIITLTRNSRPEFEEVEFLFDLYDDINIDYDLGGLLNEIVSIDVNNKKLENIYFRPIYESRLNHREEIIINESLFELLESETSFEIEYFKTFEFYNENDGTFFKDIFHFRHNFEVVKVYDEFSYLQNPTIYYSYPLWKNYLETVDADTYNYIYGEELSWFDLITISGPSEALSNYALKLFFSNENQLLDFYNNDHLDSENTNIEKSAPHFLIRLSLESLYTTIKVGLIFFLMIILLSTLFIFGIITYANYRASEKELFQFYVYGASFKKLNLVYYLQKITIAILAFFLGIIGYVILKTPLNKLLNYFIGINNILVPQGGIFVLSAFLIFILLIALVVIVIHFPLRYKRKEKANRLLRMRS